MTGATRTPPPPATPVRRAPVRGRVPLGTTVSAETLEAIEAFAPPKKMGHLIDLVLARWVREEARHLSARPTKELEELAADPGSTFADAQLTIGVARLVLETQRALDGAKHALTLTRMAQDIDARYDGCPPPLEAIRAEVYQAEAARLDAEKGGAR